MAEHPCMRLSRCGCDETPTHASIGMWGLEIHSDFAGGMIYSKGLSTSEMGFQAENGFPDAIKLLRNLFLICRLCP